MLWLLEGKVGRWWGSPTHHIIGFSVHAAASKPSAPAFANMVAASGVTSSISYWPHKNDAVFAAAYSWMI